MKNNRVMTVGTRRLLAALAMAALLCGAAPAASTEPAEPESRPVKVGDGSTGDRRVGDNGGPGIWPWVQTILALALVVAVIFALRYVLRRFGPTGVARGAAGPVEVLLRTSLSPRDRVYLVRLGDRLLLVGSGPAGPRTLCEVRDRAEADKLLASAGVKSDNAPMAGEEDAE